MTSVYRRALTLTLLGLMCAATLSSAGCMKKAPKLSDQRLMQAIASNKLPANHPLSMANAMAQGCKCHRQVN